MSKEIWSFSESESVAGEVAAAAAQLADATSSKAVIVEIGTIREGLTGQPKLLLKGPGGPDVAPDIAAAALSKAFQTAQPLAVLVGATRNGRETAARLAAKLGRGCLSEAIRVGAEGERLVIERNVYAGKFVARVASSFPAIVTIKVGTFSRIGGPKGEATEIDVGPISSGVKVLEKRAKEIGAVDLKKAKVIVSVGRGVKKKEDLAMMEDLARKMHGALGCSRPLSSDLGWLPEEHHIGLTGVTVKPDLYLALGISGQLQHIAGMKDSKVVAAVNTDKDAPIFQAADYGIVGDIYQIVPALAKALSKP